MGGNHALQDYQLQVMLLEQQNKKRLLMQQAERDNIHTEGSQEQDFPAVPEIPLERNRDAPNEPLDSTVKKRTLAALDDGSPAESTAPR
jgi:hypothetical protein